MALLIQVVALCGHDVLVMSATIRFIPSSILKSQCTYGEISCQSEQCHLLLDEAACSPQNICNFNTRYASGLSEGVLAKEKVTITSTSRQAVSFDIAFGCAHNDSFYFDAMGIIGLGLGLCPLFHKLVARGFLTACYHMVLILVLQAR